MPSPKSDIIVPLYIYPEPGAWHPLHEAVSRHPTLNFILIINPHDGPGSSAYPDDNYLREISRLNDYPNVLMVGYVRTDWGRRPIQKVLDDIAIYAGWNQNNATKAEEDDHQTCVKTGRLAVRGIFFDETPNLYTTQSAEYLCLIDRSVRDSVGIADPHMVIHNPGCIPDRRFFSNDPGPDVTVVYEQAYSIYASNKRLRSELASLPCPRSRLCYMMHSLPQEEFGEKKKKRLVELIRELRRRVGYIFLTNLDRDFYSSFDPRWMRFVEVMDE